jgi:ssDNA-binding replication factor A large subunit
MQAAVVAHLRVRFVARVEYRAAVQRFYIHRVHIKVGALANLVRHARVRVVLDADLARARVNQARGQKRRHRGRQRLERDVAPQQVALVRAVAAAVVVGVVFVELDRRVDTLLVRLRTCQQDTLARLVVGD